MIGSVVTVQGQMVDQIALAAYGRTDGATEAILAANPTLAGLPPRLPAGLTILLPTIASSPIAATVRLWD